MVQFRFQDTTGIKENAVLDPSSNANIKEEKNGEKTPATETSAVEKDVLYQNVENIRSLPKDDRKKHRERMFSEHLRLILVDAFYVPTTQMCARMRVVIDQDLNGNSRWAELFIDELHKKACQMWRNDIIITGRSLFDLYKNMMLQKVKKEQKANIFVANVGETFVLTYIIENTRVRNHSFIDNEIYMDPCAPLTVQSFIINNVPLLMEEEETKTERERLKMSLSGMHFDLTMQIRKLFKSDEPDPMVEYNQRKKLGELYTDIILEDLSNVIFELHLSGHNLNNRIVIENMVMVALKVLDRNKFILKEDYDTPQLKHNLSQIENSILARFLLPKGWTRQMKVESLNPVTSFEEMPMIGQELYQDSKWTMQENKPESSRNGMHGFMLSWSSGNDGWARPIMEQDTIDTDLEGEKIEEVD